MSYAVLLQSYDLLDIPQGPSILLVGLLALLLWAAVTFRNPAGAVMWSFSVVILVFSGLFSIGFELVWVSIIATVLVIIVGIVARWVR